VASPHRPPELPIFLSTARRRRGLLRLVRALTPGAPRRGGAEQREAGDRETRSVQA
jgi:hypothetical protein